jgi:hypothetical protein
MNKIIIENRSALLDEDALELIQKVIKLGRISNNNTQYCYLTVFTIDKYKYQVSTDLNKCSDRFVIIKEPGDDL